MIAVFVRWQLFLSPLRNQDAAAACSGFTVTKEQGQDRNPGLSAPGPHVFTAVFLSPTTPMAERLFREDLTGMGLDLCCPLWSAGLLQGSIAQVTSRASWGEAVTPP